MATSTERERLEKVLLGQSELVYQVHLWLDDEQKRDDLIRALIRSSRKEHVVHVHGIDPDRVYSEATIRDLCIKYRLRFLEGALYKGEIPPQAVQAVRVLERKADGPLVSFMVMAPASRFKLCDSEVDPLLFIPLGEGRYYLAHKWGKDLTMERAIRYWPVRRPANLILCVLALAILLSAVVPSYMISPDRSDFFTGKRLLLLFWSTMFFAGFTVFGWFAFFGQFSNHSWNSRYFN